MIIDVVSIFPDYLAPLGLSLVGKAREQGTVTINVHDLRQWTTDRHRTVDDTPLGGGAGMVMKPDVWGQALDSVFAHEVLIAPHGDKEASGMVSPDGAVTDGEEAPPRRVLIIPTPSGQSFSQRHAHDLATADHIAVACGRYEGIDARVADHYRDRGIEVAELSIGDYVLNGGEVAAMVMIEAIVRLIPGVVGNPHSLVEESHGEAGLLEYPVFTRPPSWRGLDAPAVLLSGHHGRIARWRRDQSLERTARRRPDMIEALDVTELDAHDQALLTELGFIVTSHGVCSSSVGDVAQ